MLWRVGFEMLILCACVLLRRAILRRRARAHDFRLLVVLHPGPGVHVAHGAFEEGLVVGAIYVVRQGHGHAGGQRQHAAEALRVHVVVLEPADLGFLVAGLRLQDFGLGQVHRDGPVQRDARCAGVVLGSVLVDLVLDVVVGDDDRAGHELVLLQPGIVRAVHDPLSGSALLGGEGAALDVVAVEVLVVLLGEPADAHLFDDLEG